MTVSVVRFRSVWQNPDQERTNQNARIYLKTILPKLFIIHCFCLWFFFYYFLNLFFIYLLKQIEVSFLCVCPRPVIDHEFLWIRRPL